MAVSPQSYGHQKGLNYQRWLSTGSPDQADCLQQYGGVSPEAHAFGTVECSVLIQEAAGKSTAHYSSTPGFFCVLEVPEAY